MNQQSVYAPVTKTNPVRVKLALQNERLKCAQLENELSFANENAQTLNYRLMLYKIILQLP